jgi:glycosyltransferase involved in cell wall biosynthesis
MPDVTDSRVDVVVRTYNSEEKLENCLDAISRYIPVNRLIVVDRHSVDRTVEIAKAHGAELFFDDSGLASATATGISHCSTSLLLFVDSDVVIQREDFFERALELLGKKNTGAVVGMSVGHRFLYGLPLGLTLFSLETVLDIRFPDKLQGRETYFIQRELRRKGLEVRYVLDSMMHFGTYRKDSNWPEWQGAQVRRATGGSTIELLRSFAVVLLMHMNSKKPKNVLYTPIFCTKLIRGYMSPERWEHMERKGAVNRL